MIVALVCLIPNYAALSNMGASYSIHKAIVKKYAQSLRALSRGDIGGHRRGTLPRSLAILKLGKM